MSSDVIYTKLFQQDKLAAERSFRAARCVSRTRWRLKEGSSSVDVAQFRLKRQLSPTVYPILVEGIVW